MAFIGGAIVISLCLLCFKGCVINVRHTYQDCTQRVQPDVTFDDIFDDKGDFKSEYDSNQVSMDEYISSINDLMVGNDKEID